MSRMCELTGTKPMTGNNVSHSNARTKRRFLPNLLDVKLRSEALDQTFKLKIAAKALRTVDKLGGLDGFLAKAKTDQLSAKAAKIKRDIEKKAVAAA
ncbi:MAG: 50S ribosomal protein L28 [Hyphomonadaceae bacterium]